MAASRHLSHRWWGHRRVGSEAKAAYICTDINRVATECTVETAARNKVSLEPVLTSTLDALLPRTSGQVDLLLFNPPYVVTSDEEESAAQAHAALGGAWAGGTYGTALLQRILDQGLIEQSLAPGGRLYLVAIKQNDPDGLVAQLQKRGLEAEVVLKRRANRELLHILRAIKP